MLPNYNVRAALVGLLLGGAVVAQAQTGGVRIGTTGSPDASAVLDLSPDSTAPKGLLLPRLTLARRNAIVRPAAGLVVYQTTNTPGLYLYNGTAWVPQTNDNLGNHIATQNLSLAGNALVGTGASIGTAVGVGIRADGGLNLGQNTAGNNFYLGYQSGASNTTGIYNTFVGYQSGALNTTGGHNHFIGYQSGLKNTTGYNNQFQGLQSGVNNTTGYSNQFDGLQSGFTNTTGNQNLFSGIQSGYLNTTGIQNQFTGIQSGYSNTTGYNNLFQGYQSGRANTTGNQNVFSGLQSGYSNTTGSLGVFVGYQSGYSNTTGDQNLFVGYQSGYANTTGTQNQFVGYQSGKANTTGSQNVFSGWQSGANNTTGYGNHFDGWQSGITNTTGNQNVFSGVQSGGFNTTGDQNVFVGYQSGNNNTTGDNNVYGGYQSGYNSTTGGSNLFQGHQSGYDNSTGQNNVFMGFQAGFYNVSGSSNTALGYGAGPGGASGALTNTTAIGANVRVSQSNTVVLGNNASVGIGTNTPIAKLHVSGGVSNSFLDKGYISYFAATGGFINGQASPAQNRTVCAYFEGGNVFVDNAIHAGKLQVSSDARIKHVVGRSRSSADLALLSQLQITDYTYLDPVAHGSQVTKKVIAQEVEAVLPAAVSRSTQALPNVYARATAVQFAQGVLTLTCPTPHGLPAAGGRLRLYTAANQDLSPTVTVVDAYTVRFTASEAYAEGLFVYGKYVDDFRSVDYDALTTLNVSATQELARQVATLQAQNAALRQQQQQDRTARLADHASLETLRAELARLREAVLPSTQATAAASGNR